MSSPAPRRHKSRPEPSDDSSSDSRTDNEDEPSYADEPPRKSSKPAPKEAARVKSSGRRRSRERSRDRSSASRSPPAAKHRPSKTKATHAPKPVADDDDEEPVAPVRRSKPAAPVVAADDDDVDMVVADAPEPKPRKAKSPPPPPPSKKAHKDKHERRAPVASDDDAEETAPPAREKKKEHKEHKKSKKHESDDDADDKAAKKRKKRTEPRSGDDADSDRENERSKHRSSKSKKARKEAPAAASDDEAKPAKKKATPVKIAAGLKTSRALLASAQKALPMPLGDIDMSEPAFNTMYLRVESGKDRILTAYTRPREGTSTPVGPAASTLRLDLLYTEMDTHHVVSGEIGAAVAAFLGRPLAPLAMAKVRPGTMRTHNPLRDWTSVSYRPSAARGTAARAKMRTAPLGTLLVLSPGSWIISAGFPVNYYRHPGATDPAKPFGVRFVSVSKATTLHSVGYDTHVTYVPPTGAASAAADAPEPWALFMSIPLTMAGLPAEAASRPLSTDPAHAQAKTFSIDDAPKKPAPKTIKPVKEAVETKEAKPAKAVKPTTEDEDAREDKPREKRRRPRDEPAEEDEASASGAEPEAEPEPEPEADAEADEPEADEPEAEAAPAPVAAPEPVAVIVAQAEAPVEAPVPFSVVADMEEDVAAAAAVEASTFMSDTVSQAMTQLLKEPAVAAAIAASTKQSDVPKATPPSSIKPVSVDTLDSVARTACLMLGEASKMPRPPTMTVEMPATNPMASLDEFHRLIRKLIRGKAADEFTLMAQRDIAVHNLSSPVSLVGCTREVQGQKVGIVIARSECNGKVRYVTVSNLGLDVYEPAVLAALGEGSTASCWRADKAHIEGTNDKDEQRQIVMALAIKRTFAPFVSK